MKNRLKILNSKAPFVFLQKTLLLTAVYVFFCVSLGFTGTIDSIRLLKISPEDQKAVIKTVDGKMQIIKEGDVIKGGPNDKNDELKVMEISEGRVVFEESTEKGISTVILRFKDGKQKLQRISKTGPQTKTVRGPKAIEKKAEGARNEQPPR